MTETYSNSLEHYGSAHVSGTTTKTRVTAHTAECRWPPALLEEAVHVWRWQLDVTEDVLVRHVGMLSDKELTRMMSFQFRRDRTRYAISHGMTRHLLAHYLQEDPRLLTFAEGASGKPAIDHPRTRLRFNLTHSGAHACLAISDGLDLGVDLEELRWPVPDIAEVFLSDRELTAYNLLSHTHAPEALYRAWTRKEAIAKAEGFGLSRDLRPIEVFFDRNHQPQRVHHDETGLLSKSWYLTDIPVRKGFLASLATSGIPSAVDVLHVDAAISFHKQIVH
jgi:4'-phosphopantetheinyl transferase